INRTMTQLGVPSTVRGSFSGTAQVFQQTMNSQLILIVAAIATMLDQAIQLFGLPVSMTVDLAQLRPGAQSTDYFHAILSYPQRRVILHGTMLAAAESARYIVHGSRGSYVKYGLDPQEERLKNGERLPQEDWGYDMRDGVLTLVEGETRKEENWLTLPGNYPAYYAAIRDALNGNGENPVPASQAIQIMELIELGMESAKHRATLCLA
ncbi:Gfo/Idh/MocA family oxidoreductase, partial [Salmonella enterica subsp. enterica serovar Muenchen]|nr:Gfo/Idh/MocA family oxidoreductase [Salmonella enterica subsp. enterica serovar Muenchen]